MTYCDSIRVIYHLKGICQNVTQKRTASPWYRIESIFIFMNYCIGHRKLMLLVN